MVLLNACITAEDSTLILENSDLGGSGWERWKQLYHQLLCQLPLEEMEQMGDRLEYHNPKTALLRPIIESVWQSIAYEDN